MRWIAGVCALMWTVLMGVPADAGGQRGVRGGAAIRPAAPAAPAPSTRPPIGPPAPVGTAGRPMPRFVGRVTSRPGLYGAPARLYPGSLGYGYSYPYLFGYPYDGSVSTETPNQTPPTAYPRQGEAAPPALSGNAGMVREPSSIQPPETLPQPLPPRPSTGGGIRFQALPDTAQIYVDGFYVGVVADANRSPEGLTLQPGWHRIEFRAPGYDTLAINATIEPNRTILYGGMMRALQ